MLKDAINLQKSLHRIVAYSIRNRSFETMSIVFQYDFRIVLTF